MLRRAVPTGAMADVEETSYLLQIPIYPRLPISDIKENIPPKKAKTAGAAGATAKKLPI